jgi:hypothetical protein
LGRFRQPYQRLQHDKQAAKFNEQSSDVASAQHLRSIGDDVKEL